MIPILDLTEQYATLKGEIDAAVEAVFARGHFILGPNVELLEKEIAAYCGCTFAVGLNSGTDALYLALRALGVGPGDEVITTPFTFIAPSEAICACGATPVFVDIDPATYNIDPSLIEAAITSRTKVIVPVHLYGAPAPMPEIMRIAQRHKLAVVEDCAQSIGAEIGGKRTGSFGDIGCFSFFPTKNLGAYGDGGLVTSNDPALADRVRALRAHGGQKRYRHEEVGINSRLDEVQAAILRVKLPHLPAWTETRRAVAARYGQALQGCPGIVVPSEQPGYRNVYHQYTIRVAERDAVKRALADDGVQTMIYYPLPLHLQSVHANLGLGEGSYPHAEAACREVLSLPIFPELTNLAQATVVERLLAALQRAVAV